MTAWLMKSEPEAYAWSQLVKDKRTEWNGVRNFQANNNMKAMKAGDAAFFYHSGDEKAVVGVMKIVKEWRPDPSDKEGRFGMVDVAAVQAFKRPVTLAEIKSTPALAKMAFVKQSRLSVSPVTAAEWKALVKLGA